MNLYEKLIEVRKSVPYLKKDAKGHQYEYVSGATVLGHLKAKMDELKILLIPELCDNTNITETPKKSSKGKDIIDYTLSGCMTYVFINAEKPEETIRVPFAFFGTQDDISKAFGSALTYSERYFLLKFFQIPTDKDDPDAFQKKHQKPDALMNVGQKKELAAICKNLRWEKKDLAQKYNINGKTTENEAAVAISQIHDDVESGALKKQGNLPELSPELEKLLDQIEAAGVKTPDVMNDAILDVTGDKGISEIKDIPTATKILALFNKLVKGAKDA